MRDGRILVGRYRLLRALGAGAHGTVHLAEDLGRGGRHVALKLVEGLVGGGDEPAQGILAWFRHPNWADVLDGGRFGDCDWFQVARYVPGTSLDHVAGAQPAETVRRFLEDGARVLGALHRLGVIHYDVTPGNFLMETQDGRPAFVLTDGGLAHLGPVGGVARGTPLYMAPEVTEDRSHDHRADLYSLGLVAFRLATGRDPFEGGAAQVLGRRRREAAPRVGSLQPDFPKDLDDLVADLLARDPGARPQDAATVLERLGVGARGIACDPTEAIAAASGGGIVDREPQLTRFRATAQALTQHLPTKDGTTGTARTSHVPDPVLVLQGKEGAGATRLTREFAAISRALEVPVLLLAGRDGPPDPHDPLGHLQMGLAALGRAPTSDAPAVPRRTREGNAEGAHRAIERVFRAAEEASHRTGYVLIVEDYADLPESAQEAVRVLSRHLLAKSEHGGGTAAPPMCLVVDLGRADVEPLLIPDAADFRRPVVEVEPLLEAQIAALCAARFPGLALSPQDAAALHRASHGLPSLMVALLAEGCRRGELRHDTGRWIWDLDRLGDYVVERGLSPLQETALAAADARFLALLQHLVLTEGPVPEDVLARISDSRALPASPLLSVGRRGDMACLAPASLAVRNAVRSRMDAETLRARRVSLLHVLETHPAHDLVADHARLLFDLGRPAEALKVLSQGAASLTVEDRMRLQRLLRAAVDAEPALLEDSEARSRLAGLLGQGPDAAALAQRLAARLPLGPAELSTVLRVATALENTQLNAEALSLLDAHASDASPDSVALASLHIARTRLSHNLGRYEGARSALLTAHAHLKSLGRGKRRQPRLLAQHYIANAMLVHQRKPITALRSLRIAELTARTSSLLGLRAHALNNSAVVLQRIGRRAEATQALRRSLRIKRLLGDVKGTSVGLRNLARMEEASGAFLRSADLYREAAAWALRYALHHDFVTSLRHLSLVYDQQGSSGLALTTMKRARKTAVRFRLATHIGPLAWDTAPLAACLGDAGATREALSSAAHEARTQPRDDSRAEYYLAAAITSLHLGHTHEARRSFKRAVRRRKHLQGTHAQRLHLLGPLFEVLSGSTTALVAPPEGRPALHDPLRTLFRARTWLTSVIQGKTRFQGVPSPASSRGGIPPGAEGRLLIEHLFAASKAPAGELRRGLVALEAALGRTDLSVLQARCLARLASTPELQPSEAARLFAQAVACLPTGDSSTEDAQPPDELCAAAALLTPSGHRTNLASAVSLRSLAFSLLSATRALSASDHRLTAALRRVLEAAASMRAGAGVEALLESITRNSIEVTGAQRACVVLLEQGTGLRIRVATGASKEQGRISVNDLSHTVIRRVIVSKEPLLLHDVFEDDELLGRPSILSMSLRSALCVPMMRGSVLYGVMYADTTAAAAAFDRVDLQVLTLFAEQAAAALESARLVENLQKSYAELKTLQERLVRGERLRVIGELSSGVAHEFNNLLTAILARVQMMGMGYLSSEMRKDLDLIEKAALDAAGVVRRLQSFSKQQRQGDFTIINMVDICTDAIDFLRPLWRGRRTPDRPSVNVQLHATNKVWVRGDPTQLREIVTNLVKNAIDALTGGGVIEVGVTEREGTARLVVHDSGPGIPADILPKVFDPFFTTKGERGTGLGLCLSQQIAERHGGSIAIESQVGRGTTVTVCLPVADPSATGRSSSEAEPAVKKPSVRIVVVDDDQDVLRPLCAFLRRSGYEVVAVADAAEGLRVICRDVPDVVLSDIGMPGMNGIELCRRVQEVQPSIPIVLMSGWASEIDPAQVRASGAQALLAKPFAMQQVADLLQGLAKSRQDES